jgi:hypothetical protein
MVQRRPMMRMHLLQPAPWLCTSRAAAVRRRGAIQYRSVPFSMSEALHPLAAHGAAGYGLGYEYYWYYWYYRQSGAHAARRSPPARCPTSGACSPRPVQSGTRASSRPSPCCRSNNSLRAFDNCWPQPWSDVKASKARDRTVLPSSLAGQHRAKTEPAPESQSRQSTEARTAALG